MQYVNKGEHNEWMHEFSKLLDIENKTVIKLNTTAFYKSIISDKFSQIIDVRTPEEFSEGYITNAINVNWNDCSSYF